MSPTSRRDDGWLACAIAVVAGLGLAVHGDLASAPARSDAAPPAAFSSERAAAVLERLLGDGAPRPTGSPALAEARSRLLGELQGLGYTPEVQRAVGCWRRGACASVRNVVARRPGTEGGPAVLVASHLDTQPHTPGAADAGAGVASLVEIARALAAAPPVRHDVILLASDAEEQGMLGAAAFLRHHPAARGVGAVVNLDARGTTGPSILTEVGPESGALVHVLGARCDGVAASSFVAGVASQLPPHSDFFLFAAAGVPGLELTFVDGWARYHTPVDDLAHLDLDSVAHQGTCALALVRALAEGPLPPSGGDQVFFTAPLAGVVGWPVAWSLPLAIAAAVLVVAAVAVLGGRRIVSVRSLLWGLAAAPAAFAVSVALCGALGTGLRAWSGVRGPLGGVEFPWTASPGWAALAFWAAALAGSTAAVGWIAIRAGFFGAWCGVWVECAGLALVAAVGAPKLSAPVLVPSLVAGAAFWLLGVWRAEPGSARARWAALAALAAGAALLVQLTLLVQRFSGDPGFAPILALGVAMAAPFLAAASPGVRRAIPALAAVGLVVGGLVALASEPFDADHPREISLHYVESDRKGAHWVVNIPSGSAPAPLAAALGVDPETALETELRPDMTLARVLTAEAPAAATPAPILEVFGSRSEGRRRDVRLRLRSARGAQRLELCLDADAELLEAAFEGEPLPPPGPEVLPARRRCLAYVGPPPSGVALRLVLAGTGPVAGTIRDVAWDLPPFARPLVDARPESAVPRHGGDRWVVEQGVRF